METSRKLPERVADNFWFVFSAYFLAVAAWHAVSGNVFISSRWRTVAETRKRGQRHLFVLSVGLSYLVVYVYFQAKSGDHMEVFLTLVASVVAISHMLQTVLGLWQLHVFKHWVIRSVCSMQSLGYRSELSRAEDERNTLRGRSSVAPEQGGDGAHFDPDGIIVNDTIIGSRLSDGEVQCYLWFFNPDQKHGISSAGCILARVLWTLLYAVESMVCLGAIVWPSLFSRSPLYSKLDSTLFLQPRKPEELWLRWATLLISCAFPDWATDMRKSRSEESMSQESECQVHRDRFAEEILLSAALHCERDTIKTSPGSLLPFHLWRKFPKLCSGMFCKQEFLKHACSTGNGLPFQAPHMHAASRIEEDLIYSYAKYHSKLEEARDNLPAKEGEKLACLGIEELEWLSIFLSVEDWSIGTLEEDNGSAQPPPSDSSCIAVENLNIQLGFPESVKGFSERLAAPFVKGKERATLWGNRNALTLSAHVDNWLALFAGDQATYTAEQVPGMEEVFLFRNLKVKDSANRTQESVGVMEGITKERICLEKQRLMFQRSVADPEYSYVEQSLTFLGCSMENLRTGLAKWVENNPEEQSGAWVPRLGSSKVGTDAVNAGEFVFHASENFVLCLSEVISVSCWSQRYLQMRLLWELQNNLHSTVSGRGLSPNRTEAMLLCILSFPAIRVIASEIEQRSESAVSVQGNRNFCCIKIDEKPATFCIEDWKLTLRAAYGPQNVHTEVFFTRQVNESGIVVTAHLCGDEFEEGKSFVWEAWRDAFYNSLQSTRRLQIGHKVANSSLSVRPCIDRIGAGICEIETANSGIGPTMKVWKGWPPHTETLSKYEMTTDGLILERKAAAIPANTRLDHRKVSISAEHPRIQYVPVSYEEATGQYLTRASLIAQDFLRKTTDRPMDETVSGRSKGHRDLELLRYEMSAAKAGDDIALGKAMNMLISGNSNREVIEQAVGLLEEYFISEAVKAPSNRILASLSRPARKENWVQQIKGYYEVLMTVTRFDPIAAISFAGFCSTAPTRQLLNEDGIRAVAIALLRTTFSRNILAFELLKSLEMLLDIGNEEWYLACSMALNQIEYAGTILRQKRNSVALTNAQHLSDEKHIPLLPDFRLELEKIRADAQDRLEQLFQIGTHSVGEYVSRAEKLYIQAAIEGDLLSSCHLGTMIQYRIRLDRSRAKELYRQAAELYTRAMTGGISAALCPLAGFYADGRGVSRNPSYAAELYTRAIEERGDITAMYNLADILEKGAEGVPVDLPRAVQLFSRAVEEGGDVDAMVRLANLLRKAPEGVPKDVPYAVRLYERAIKEQGDHRVKVNLANVLETGADGVPVNLRRATALYKNAVKEGDNTTAMYKLGQLCLKATRVPAGAVLATRLFQRGVDKDGDVNALVCLADVLIEGARGVPQDPVRAVELYSRAIEEHGSGTAMFELASLLEFGKKGVPADSARAFSLYKRAASEKKHRGAARRLEKVEKQKQVLEQVQRIWSK